jgi:hypothetical protein
VSAQFLAFLLIFGLGHPARDPVDPAKSVPLQSRIPCDGHGGPEESVHVQVTFSPSSASAAAAREFVVSRYEIDKCTVETMFQCWHKQRAGWRDVWSAANTAPNAQPSTNAILPLASCYEWGSSEPAKYILSGWYQEGSETKPMWRQAPVKQVSAEPEVYEFTDPNGATARLEIRR